MNWAAQSLQFALFCNGSTAQPEVLSPWHKLFQGMPQNFQNSPPGTQPAQSSASGTVDGLSVSLVAQFGRFDLHIAPVESGALATFPLLTDVPGLIALGQKYAKAFIEFQPALRLAFVLNLAAEVHSQAEANEEFAKISSTPPTGPHCTDHFFQVNHPVDDGNLSVRINRLVRLQTQVVHLMSFALGGPGAAAISPYAASHLVTMTVDVNTAQNQTPFDKDHAVPILDRLATEALNTMSGGYAYLG